MSSGPSIVIVDDDLTGQELTRSLLELVFPRARFSVHTAAREGLAMVQGGKVHLLVTDNSMWDMSGLELVRLSRALQPTLPIVVLSGSHEIEGPALAAGANAFIRSTDSERLLEVAQGLVGTHW